MCNTNTYYNNEIKCEYLNTLEGKSLDLMRTHFKNTKHFEEDYECDLCDWNEEQIKNFLLSLNSSSKQAVAGINSLLKKYTQWCINNNINSDNINHYNNITYEEITGLLNPNANKFIIKSKEEIIEIANRYVNVSDRFLLLCLFEGIQLNEISFIQIEDIDTKKEKIILRKTGREIKVDKSLCELGIESCKNYEYLPCNGKSDFKKTTVLLAQDKTAVKLSSNAKKFDELSKVNACKNRLKKIKEEEGTSVMLSVDRIKKAGFIYYLKELAQKYNVEINENFWKKSPFWDKEEVKELKVRYGIDREKKPSDIKTNYKDFV